MIEAVDTIARSARRIELSLLELGARPRTIAIAIRDEHTWRILEQEISRRHLEGPNISPMEKLERRDGNPPTWLATLCGVEFHRAW